LAKVSPAAIRGKIRQGVAILGKRIIFNEVGQKPDLSLWGSEALQFLSQPWLPRR
jgi:hypothetical protein